MDTGGCEHNRPCTPSTWQPMRTAVCNPHLCSAVPRLLLHSGVPHDALQPPRVPLRPRPGTLAVRPGRELLLRGQVAYVHGRGPGPAPLATLGGLAGCLLPRPALPWARCSLRGLQHRGRVYGDQRALTHRSTLDGRLAPSPGTGSEARSRTRILGYQVTRLRNDRAGLRGIHGICFRCMAYGVQAPGTHRVGAFRAGVAVPPARATAEST